MKTGILTFHWASNYGAVLQSFCLQEFLSERGKEVEIINYIPKAGKFSWVGFLKHRRTIKEIIRYANLRRRNASLEKFRKRNLHLSHLLLTEKEVDSYARNFNVLISGSDQVLNPNMVRYAESGISCVYFLPFAKEIKKIGYAVSFGCEHYPADLVPFLSDRLNGFDAVLYRERSGKKILDGFGYQGHSELVLDPVFLYGSALFQKLGIKPLKSGKTLSFFLRREVVVPDAEIIDDRNGSLSLENWIARICGCGRLITNSYHAALLAILSHTSFAVVVETDVEKMMKDRFTSILQPLGLEDRICGSVKDALAMKDISNWSIIDAEASEKRLYSSELLLSLMK